MFTHIYRSLSSSLSTYIHTPTYPHLHTHTRTGTRTRARTHTHTQIPPVVPEKARLGMPREKIHLLYSSIQRRKRLRRQRERLL